MLRCQVPWQIEYYEHEGSEQPAEKFEDGISPRLAGKLARIAVALREHGPRLGGGLIEKCRDYPSVWEMRAILQNDLAREFFGFDHRRVVLLDGIVKRAGQPTPTSALVRAARCWKGYLASRKVSSEVKEHESV